MSTKIVIIGKEGEPVNGRNAYIEVNGEQMYGQMSLNVEFPIDDIAVAYVKIALPKIEYRDK